VGRPYQRELRRLPETVKWACSLDITPLEAFVRESAAHPLVAIGSGGSSTAAHFAALLHRERHRGFARHATPLEILTNEPGLAGAAALLTSASGRNRDVLAALQTCLRNEVPVLGTLTTRMPSRLADSARPYCRSYVQEGELPAGKDGYLATNSLVATLVILSRAYGFDPTPRVELGGPVAVRAPKSTVLVLHGGWASPAATDLESKLNESAMAAALIADYRNFGHGRHLWLAKHGPETLVVALSTPEVDDLATRTLALLPRTGPVLRLRTRLPGPRGTLALIGRGLAFIGAFAEALGVDPGRPRVPPFGRKVYGLDARIAAKGLTPVARKQSRAPSRAPSLERVYQNELGAFLKRLAGANIGGVVFDYDGTLCATRDREAPLSKVIASELARLCRAGVRVGVATGRGDSVRANLRAVLPRTLWSSIRIGYHNGTEIGLLADDAIPRDASTEDGSREVLVQRLRADPVLSEVAQIRPTANQISIRPRAGFALEPRTLVSHVVPFMPDRDARVVASSHSVDIITARGSKADVAKAVADELEPPLQLLTIGDRGAWPGNDYDLLSEPLSLSVDEPSSIADRCWNLAPPGVTGPAAALFVLKRLKLQRGRVRFDIRGIN
jgi:hypothetical protein